MAGHSMLDAILEGPKPEDSPGTAAAKGAGSVLVSLFGTAGTILFVSGVVMAAVWAFGSSGGPSGGPSETASGGLPLPIPDRPGDDREIGADRYHNLLSMSKMEPFVRERVIEAMEDGKITDRECTAIFDDHRKTLLDEELRKVKWELLRMKIESEGINLDGEQKETEQAAAEDKVTVRSLIP